MKTKSDTPEDATRPDKERLRRLESSAKRLRHLLMASPAIIYTRGATSQHPFTFLSEAVGTGLGHSPEEFLRAPDFWLARLHQDDRERAAAAFDAADGQGVCEYRIMHANGSFRWMHDSFRAISGVDGTPGEIVGCWVDITDRKRAEFLLERQTKRLERSNRELEEFAYGASHDLRAPLRAIDTLSSWIQSDLKGTASGETSEQITLLRGRVRRMDRLLCDLLEYARVGRIDLTAQLVDVRELLEEVMDLSNAPPRMRLVPIEPLPCFETPRLPLKRVLLNLIGNAVKHHDRADGRIEVRCRESGEFYELSVTDDGPGIPAEYRQRIFQMFQTLRPRDAVEGSGMGLALVRRIVEGANGGVWAEAAWPRGAVFRFTWPRVWGKSRISLSQVPVAAPVDAGADGGG